jgi:hypothetical protein
MDPIYIEVLKQWMFFFGLMTMLLMPAIMFRKIATRHNKNGWWYCLIGLGVSGILLIALRTTGFVVTRLNPPKHYNDYISFGVLAIYLSGAFVAIALLKRRMSGKRA